MALNGATTRGRMFRFWHFRIGSGLAHALLIAPWTRSGRAPRARCAEPDARGRHELRGRKRRSARSLPCDRGRRGRSCTAFQAGSIARPRRHRHRADDVGRSRRPRKLARVRCAAPTARRRLASRGRARGGQLTLFGFSPRRRHGRQRDGDGGRERECDLCPMTVQSWTHKATCAPRVSPLFNACSAAAEEASTNVRRRLRRCSEASRAGWSSCPISGHRMGPFESPRSGLAVTAARRADLSA